MLFRSGRGSAIIALPDGVQASFLVGEDVLPGVRLKTVVFDEVTLDRGGTSESLFLDQSSGGVPVTPESEGAATSPPIRPSPTSLAAEIQAMPRLNGQTVTGYILSPKGSGTAFAAAGLVPGDVLVSIDGAPVAAVGDPAALARRLNGGRVSISVERAGSVVSLQIGGGR